MLRSHSDVISLWPTVAAFAADIGVNPSTARVMKARGNIDSAHWRKIAQAAKRRGYRNVTVATLAMTQKPRRRSSEMEVL